MESCPRAFCRADILPDAQFCVRCGYPVVQDCPYETCDGRVPLVTGGRPTTTCPTCRRAFNVDPVLGRLYRVDETTDVPVVSSIHPWTGVGGDSGHSHRIALDLPTLPQEVRERAPSVLLDVQEDAPGRGLVVLGNRFLTLVGTKLVYGDCGLGPEYSETRLEPRAEPQSLVLAGDRVAVLGPAEVRLFDTNAGHLRGTILGTFRDQCVGDDGTWYGLETIGELSRVIRHRSHDGAAREEIGTSLPRPGFSIVPLGGSLAVADLFGEVRFVPLDGWGPRMLQPPVGLSDAAPHALAASDGRGYLLVKRDSGPQLVTFNAAGQRESISDVPLANPLPIVAIGKRRVYLFGTHPDPMFGGAVAMRRVGDATPFPIAAIPACRRVLGALVLTVGNEETLVVAVEDTMGFGAVLFLTPETMNTRQIATFSAGAPFQMAVAQDRLLTLSSERRPGGNVLRSYDLLP